MLNFTARAEKRHLRNATTELMRTGHAFLPISPEISEKIQDAFEAAREFFSLPESEKRATTASEGCGYRPAGIEFSQTRQRPDAVESFTVMSQATNQMVASSCARRLHESMARIYARLAPLSEKLISTLAYKITADNSNGTIQKTFRLCSCLQLNYARPSQCAAEFINDLHEDGHLLTLACASAPGLELKIGHILRGIAPSFTEMVVMPGEIAWFMSGEMIKPLYHQVRPIRTYSERFSLMFFIDLHPDECEPWVKTEINRSIDIPQRIHFNPTRFGLPSTNVS